MLRHALPRADMIFYADTLLLAMIIFYAIQRYTWLLPPLRCQHARDAFSRYTLFAACILLIALYVTCCAATFFDAATRYAAITLR